ncbi:hypothetical protein C5167_046827 [Papaver somniferum]|uniref:Uncharacterized protein n=1 Tax=Papaver somniferum TaxID=3469 RepID=A0A4Y7LHB2_PAPSO|nr:hypothetical protein C5167_046827 [Papaver somniferum]
MELGTLRLEIEANRHQWLLPEHEGKNVRRTELESVDPTLELFFESKLAFKVESIITNRS